MSAMDIVLVLSGIGLLAGSGLPGLVVGAVAAVGRTPPRPGLLRGGELAARLLKGGKLANECNPAEGLSVVLMVLGAVVGLVGAAVNLAGGGDSTFTASWSIPWGSFSIRIDGLAALFLLPVFLVPGLGAIYGAKYWNSAEHPESAARLRFFYGVLAASLALVVISRDMILFLMAWEVMALAGFFLVTTEDDQPEVRKVGWIYLVASHLAVLCLIALFSLLHRATGSFVLEPVGTEILSAGEAAAIFLLALAGFGLKAGIMPLHVWLPGAHAMAPSHVSAVMSGVLIKLGIYGLVRVTGLLPDPPVSWGAALLALGVVSGILGVAFAIGQHDLKRLLAYHSIENIGIIVMGLGLALIGRSQGRADWVALGLAGSLLHVWNHALFKSLLFFSAGSVLHAVYTREIDRMGGLARRMPYTSVGFLIGAVAICGLPPLNGFVSEFLLYLGLARTVGVEGGTTWVGAAFGIPALALIGALAVACFVKVFGAVFLGEPRTHVAEGAYESPPAMLVPLVVLSGICAFIGLLPMRVTPVLDRAVAAWVPGGVKTSDAGEGLATMVPPGVFSLAPLGWVSFLAILLSLLGVGGIVLLWRQMKRGVFQTVGTWDCGYAAPTARMQYTSSSFAQMLVALFSWALRPKVHGPHVRGLFPEPARFESHVDDTVLEGVAVPALRLVERAALRLRWLQAGRVQLYILYILVILLFLLAWLLPVGEYWGVVVGE